MDYWVRSVSAIKKLYRAKLTRSGKLDIRCASAYGRAGDKFPQDDAFMLSVYVLAYKAQTSKKPDPDLCDICVWRGYTTRYCSHEEQRELLEFHALAFATKIGCDFEHRLPISTRPPKEN